MLSYFYLLTTLTLMRIYSALLSTSWSESFKLSYVAFQSSSLRRGPRTGCAHNDMGTPSVFATDIDSHASSAASAIPSGTSKISVIIRSCDYVCCFVQRNLTDG